MPKYLVLAAALVVLAVACNKKEEAAPAEGTTVEQTAPATETEAAPADAPATDAPATDAPAEVPADAPAAE